jgi:hypothetical protein
MPGMTAGSPFRNSGKIEAMKHLLSGTAIAAALVIAAPVWAQAAPMKPSPTALSARSAPMGSHMRSHRVDHRVNARHHHARRRGSARPSDHVANRLNAQEIARNSGGGMGGAPAPAYGGGMGGAPAPAYGGGMGGAPAPAYGGPTTGPYSQPNQLYGIPGAGQPSASGPVPGSR